MTATPAIHHRGFRVIAHPTGTHLVPPGTPPHLVVILGQHFLRASRKQNFLCLFFSMTQHLSGVSAQAVGNLWSGNTVTVGQVRIERDAVVLLG